LNYSKMFELLSHLTTLVKISMEKVFETLMDGDWVLGKNMITPLERHGKRISQYNPLDDDEPTGFHLKSEDDWTYLMDENDKVVYKISTGLLDSSRFPDDEKMPDFEVFGLSIRDISKLGCFNEGFNIMYKRQEDTLFALRDLKVTRQPISDVTKIRLKLPNTWETYLQEDMIDKELTEIGIIGVEKKDVESGVESGETDDENYIDDYLEELKKEPEELREMLSPLEDDVSYLKDFVNKFNLTGLFNTFQSSPKIVRARLNWMKIKRMKSTLIAHQCLRDMRINRKIISEIYKMTNEEGVLSALVMFYDVIFTNTDAMSPKDVTMSINGDFISKFNLDDDDSIVLH
jgi:hypothetical protein